MLGLIGKKIGMTRIFDDSGLSIPVSVINIETNYITNIKKPISKDYLQIQITTGKKTKKIKKTESKFYNRIGIPVGMGLWEFKVNSNTNFKTGDLLSVTFFNNIQHVDVTGTSKGKGFSGVIKRWNFSSQDASHGNSLSHRAPGSIGQNQSPGRVFKGKKMAGHLGNVRKTVQNLKVIRTDKINNILIIKGAIPGFNGSLVIIKPSIKKQ